MTLEEYKELWDNIPITKHKITPNKRKMASGMVVCKDDLISITAPITTPPTKYGVRREFPFEIVTKEYLEENKGWFTFEYVFVDSYDKAVKEMALESYKYYKTKGDKIMTRSYINVIEDLKKEKPELWI